MFHLNKVTAAGNNPVLLPSSCPGLTFHKLPLFNPVPTQLILLTVAWQNVTHITIHAILITSVHSPNSKRTQTPQHLYMFKFTCIAYNSSLLLCEHLMEYHLASKDQGSLFREENVCDTSLAVPSINLNKHCTCKSFLMLPLVRQLSQ